MAAASIVDSIITTYEIRDHYTEKLNVIARSTEALGSKVSGLQGTLKSLESGLSSLAVHGVQAIASGVIGLGVAAVQSAISFEKLQFSLEFFTGSAEKAKQKLDFIKKLSIPATQPFSELAEAGLTLEKFGVRLERFLPQLAKASFVPGSLGIEALARAVGRLSTGKFPSISVLASVGISKKDFENQGIQFDRGGKLLSSANKALDAFRTIIDQKYGGILDRAGQLTESKLDSLNNTFQESLRKLGFAILPILNPIIDDFTKFFENLNKDKGFETFLKNIGKNLVLFVGITLGAIGALQFAIAGIRFAAKDFVGAFISVVAGVATLAAGAAFTNAASKKLKQLSIGGKGGNQGEVPTDNGPNFEPGKGLNADDEHLKQIATNTKTIAVNTTPVKAFALGGGPIGQLGITPVEFAAFRNRNSNGASRTNITVTGGDELSRAVHQLVANAIDGYDYARRR